MSWDNYGEWEIDHIIPINFQIFVKDVDGNLISKRPPTEEEVIERLHCTNTQPMWASENMKKGNRYCGKFNPDYK